MADNHDEQLREIMARIFEVPLSEITHASSLESVESWDSLRHMNLIVALEEEFSVRFPEDKIAYLTSFQLIRSALQELKRNPA